MCIRDSVKARAPRVVHPHLPRGDLDVAVFQVLDVGAAGPPAAGPAGGAHVHSGTTCASAGDGGGHYFEGMADDPWTTNYESDSVGSSTTSLSLDDFTLDGAYPVAGRAVVIHAADGTRIGCGVLA